MSFVTTRVAVTALYYHRTLLRYFRLGYTLVSVIRVRFATIYCCRNIAREFLRQIYDSLIAGI